MDRTNLGEVRTKDVQLRRHGVPVVYDYVSPFLIVFVTKTNLSPMFVGSSATIPDSSCFTFVVNLHSNNTDIAKRFNSFNLGLIVITRVSATCIRTLRFRLT